MVKQNGASRAVESSNSANMRSVAYADYNTSHARGSIALARRVTARPMSMSVILNSIQDPSLRSLDAESSSAWRYARADWAFTIAKSSRFLCMTGLGSEWFRGCLALGRNSVYTCGA